MPDEASSVLEKNGERRRSRRRWISLLLIAWLILVLVALIWRAPDVEDRLRTQTRSALKMAGLTTADVSISGRDAVVTGEVELSGDIETALETVSGHAGIRSAKNSLAVNGHAYEFHVSKAGQARSDAGKRAFKALEQLLNSRSMVLFKPSSNRLSEGATGLLERIAVLLEEHPSCSLDITVNAATTAEAQKAANLRARTLADHLMALGVSSDRVTARAARAESEKQRLRVEFNLKEN